jgi:hypothetical protein
MIKGIQPIDSIPTVEVSIRHEMLGSLEWTEQVRDVSDVNLSEDLNVNGIYDDNVKLGFPQCPILDKHIHSLEGVVEAEVLHDAIRIRYLVDDILFQRRVDYLKALDADGRTQQAVSWTVWGCLIVDIICVDVLSIPHVGYGNWLLLPLQAWE